MTVSPLSVILWQEALHREQMLEQKLATLQRLLANTQEASESSWQVGNNTLVTSGGIQRPSSPGQCSARANMLHEKLIQRVDVLTRL